MEMTTAYAKMVAEKHSTRAFINRVVEKDTIWEILDEAARSTGTSRNAQEYKVYVTIGDKTERIRSLYLKADAENMSAISDLSAHRTGTWSQKAVAHRVAFDKSIRDFLGDDLGQYLNAQNTLFHAPALLVFTIPDMDNDWAIYDLGSFTQSVQMSALARGVASVVAYSIVKYPQILRKELLIPDEEHIIIGIALGYPTDDKVNDFRTPRMAVEEYTKVYGE